MSGRHRINRRPSRHVARHSPPEEADAAAPPSRRGVARPTHAARVPRRPRTTGGRRSSTTTPLRTIALGGALAALLVTGVAVAWVVLSGSPPIEVAKVGDAGSTKVDLSAFGKNATAAMKAIEKESDGADGIKIASFLGNEYRRFYGKGPVPEKLKVIWRNRIGSGKTSGTASSTGTVVWSGTGWTGQPTLVRQGGRNYIVVGGFDHGLRKIDAQTGKTIWRYEFDDVIKGTNTVFVNPSAKSAAERIVVVVGSRKGVNKRLGSPGIEPLRAVSFATGKELWRVAAPLTRSYSRDADSSPWLVGKWLYAAVESGYLYKLDPASTVPLGDKRTPKKVGSVLCYETSDSAKHRGNLVLEGSPAVLGDRIYIAAGSGHIYGIRQRDMKKVWDFKTGSDLDSTVVVNKSNRLLVGIEKQYVARGGVIMLDPSRKASKSVVWFFPTGNRNFEDWEGGVIGSVAINDEYDEDGSKPALAAVNAIDGNMYVVSQDTLAKGKVLGFDGKTSYPTPVTVYKDYIGGAISTPIIVDDHVVAAGYDARVHVYRITYGKPGNGVTLPTRNGKAKRGVRIKEVASFKAGAFESTPIVWRGRIYIGSRDGTLYCLGAK